MRGLWRAFDRWYRGGYGYERHERRRRRAANRKNHPVTQALKNYDPMTESATAVSIYIGGCRLCGRSNHAIGCPNAAV
jgi:hypothetical protein